MLFVAMVVWKFEMDLGEVNNRNLCEEVEEGANN